MRKILLLALFVSCFMLPFAAYAGVPEAVAYLENQTLDDWTAMAFKAAGEQGMDASPLKSFSGSLATDYAKRILSLIALGKDPTTYTGTDLVSGLKGMAQAGQIGNADWLNDDAWGVLALRAAGVPTSDTAVKSAAEYLAANQNLDGGWSWGAGFDSDTNDTAAVLMALSEVGYASQSQAVQNALDYLADTQGDDAGWPYESPCFWPGCETSDAASTAWVISALTKLKLDPASWTKSGRTPFDFLQSLQTADGSFKWQSGDASGSQAMTAYAVVALAGSSYPVARGNYLGYAGKTLTPLADLALAADTETVAVEAGEIAQVTFTLTNHGPNLAQQLAVAFALPPGVEIISGQPTGGTFDAKEAKWTFVRLNNYAWAQLSLSLRAVTVGEGELTASASAKEMDIDDSNNGATVAVSASVAQEAVPEEPGEVLGQVAYSCELAGSGGEAQAWWLGHALKASQAGAAWYYEPASRIRYCLQDEAAAYRALELFGLGITNQDLSRIPAAPGQMDTVEAAEADAALAMRLKGRILLQAESVGEAWYVDPRDGLRYYLKDGAAVLQHMSGSALQVPASDLAAVPAAQP